jgi:hypothetical protein
LANFNSFGEERKMKRSILVLGFVMVMSITSIVNALDIKWDGGGGNTLWSNPLNWVGDVVPPAGYRVLIDSAAATVDYDISSISITKMLIGSTSGATINFAAGSMTNPSYWIIGQGANVFGTVNITGADVSLSTRDFNLGAVSGTGYANISAGLLTVTGAGTGVGLSVSFDATSSGELNISGTGKVVAKQLTMNGNGLINIADAGILQLTGDVSSQVNSFITAGKIKAYDGTGVVNVSYDGANTIVSAVVPEPATMLLVGLGILCIRKK